MLKKEEEKKKKKERKEKKKEEEKEGKKSVSSVMTAGKTANTRLPTSDWMSFQTCSQQSIPRPAPKSTVTPGH